MPTRKFKSDYSKIRKNRRIEALTILVPVASAERSFSKLKIIKTYLRSTMSEERLDELVLLYIEKEILNKINYDNLINNFPSKKARKIHFK